MWGHQPEEVFRRRAEREGELFKHLQFSTNIKCQRPCKTYTTSSKVLTYPKTPQRSHRHITQHLQTVELSGMKMAHGGSVILGAPSVGKTLWLTTRICG